MAYFKRVTNVDQQIEEKMNYFLNRFQHMNENSGDEAFFELETPLSITEKIYFLIANETDSDFIIKYLDIFFRNPIFLDKDLWNTFPAYNRVKSIIDQYLQKSHHESKGASRSRKSGLVSTNTFIGDVVNLIGELKESLPRALHARLISVLSCPMPLDEHQHPEQLSALARLYVSGAYYSGKSAKEVNEIISRIFDGDKDRFPFPPDVKTARARKKLLAQGTLDTQIRAFQTLLYDNRKLGKVIMKLYGGWFPTNFEFKYQHVLFLGQGHEKIAKLRTTTHEDNFTSFFSSDNNSSTGYIYVCTDINSFTHSSVRLTMKDVTADAIKFLSGALKKDFILDTTDNYAIANHRWRYLGGYWSSRKYETPFGRNEIEGLLNNAFEILKRHRHRTCVNWFLSKESLYSEARKTGIAADFWQYLESLISFPGKNWKVDNILPYVLLLNANESRKRRVLNTLINGSGFLSGGEAVFGLSFEDLVKANNSLIAGHIPETVRQQKSMFIQELVSQFDNEADTDYWKMSHAYYVRNLTESYGLRNFQVHRGLNSADSQIKTQHTLPYMITRFRWLLFDELKRSRYVNFGEMLEHLITKGKAMLNE
jgi:hypothetical protein